jgi:hypothetical protein
MVFVIFEVCGRTEGQMERRTFLYPLAEDHLFFLALVVGALDQHILSVLHLLTSG